MKARQLMAIVLLSGLLLSCQLTKKTSSFVVSFQTCEFEKRSTPVYDIATMNGHSSTNAEMYKLEDVDLYFNPEFEEAPYITLGDYAKLLSSYFRPQCKYEVLKEGNEEMLALYEEHGEPVYQIIVNYAKASFTYAGDPSPIIKPTSEDEGLDISKYAKITADWAKLDSIATEESFANNNLPIFRNARIFYLPLALWEARVGTSANVHHFYSGESLFRYEEAAQLKQQMVVGAKIVTPTDYWTNYALNHGGMPNGIALSDADVFYYKMNNSYGLRQRKIGSAAYQEYYKEQLIDDRKQLNSTDPTIHTQAILSALNVLDDDHTGVTSFAPWWGENGDGLSDVRGPNSVARSALAELLTEKRQEAFQNDGVALDGIRISRNRSLAFFSFDSFSIEPEVYKNGVSRASEELKERDTYCYISKRLSAIMEMRTVNKVIIDISLNGGGVVAVLYKLLSLLNTSITSTTFMQQGSNGVVRVVTSNEFNYRQLKFFLLTSNVSFSCGNALPFYAKKQRTATIIGQKTGGGECALEETYLPSGIHFVHSSNNHIGWYTDSNGFEGCEDGVEPAIELSYDEFYDLGVLQTKVVQ